MNVGWAYMGIAAILIIFGAITAINGYDPYGDLLIVSSLPFIYKGSTELANAPTGLEGADDTESTE